MDGRQLAMLHGRSSMVIDDFHIVRFTALPAEAHAVLLVDADAMLPLAIAAELLQTISRRAAQVFQRLPGVQEQQLSQGRALQRASHLTARFALKQPRRLSVAEAPDHPRHVNATR